VPIRDPGLQPERTSLAWQRTGIATMLVGSGAALASAHGRSTPVLVLAVAACLAVGIVVLTAARLPSEAPYRRLVHGASGTIVIAVVGVALALS
jgi:Domain of unknown function (DUF202)